MRILKSPPRLESLRNSELSVIGDVCVCMCVWEEGGGGGLGQKCTRGKVCHQYTLATWYWQG